MNTGVRVNNTTNSTLHHRSNNAAGQFSDRQVDTQIKKDFPSSFTFRRVSGFHDLLSKSDGIPLASITKIEAEEQKAIQEKAEADNFLARLRAESLKNIEAQSSALTKALAKAQSSLSNAQSLDPTEDQSSGPLDLYFKTEYNTIRDEICDHLYKKICKDFKANKMLINYKHLTPDHLKSVVSECTSIMSNLEINHDEKMTKICSQTNPIIGTLFFLMKEFIKNNPNFKKFASSFVRTFVTRDWIETIHENIKPLFKEIVKYRLLAAKYFEHEKIKIFAQISQHSSLTLFGQEFGRNLFYSLCNKYKSLTFVWKYSDKHLFNQPSKLFENANDLAIFKVSVMETVFNEVQEALSKKIDQLSIVECDSYEIGIGREGQCCIYHDFIYQILPELHNIENSLDSLTLLDPEKIKALKKFVHGKGAMKTFEKGQSLFLKGLANFQKIRPDIISLDVLDTIAAILDIQMKRAKGIHCWYPDIEETLKKGEDIMASFKWHFKVSKDGNILEYKKLE